MFVVKVVGSKEARILKGVSQLALKIKVVIRCLIKPGVSNTRTIVVESSATSENSSKETSLGEGIKRPIAGNESDTSSLSSFGAEETKCNDDLEVAYLSEETSPTVP